MSIHVESALKADFYVSGRNDPSHLAFRHLRQYAVSGTTISVAPPEYVILRKLQYFREGGSEKHLRDIRSILAVSGAELDRSALAEWVERLNLPNEWRRVAV